VAHLWRTSGDLSDQWSGGNTSILATVNRQADVLRWAGPGFWADPDALQVGLHGRQPQFGSPFKGMSESEYRAHFSLWAIMCAPLFISLELRELDEATLKILLNRDVIAVNQDPLGVPGRRVRTLRQDGGEVEVFTKRLSDGSAAVALLNRATAADIGASADDLGIDDPGFAKRPWDVRDLWTGESRHVTDGVVTAKVEGHGVTILRIKPS
jgi:alpha-galactosidase